MDVADWLESSVLNANEAAARMTLMPNYCSL
jgi:hypothetical protein